MSINQKAQKLANYVRNLKNFAIQDSIDGNYDHMGATITDAMLQAGTRYETVVSPRVRRIRSTYPQVKTTSGFLQLIMEKGIKNIKWLTKIGHEKGQK